MKYEEDNFSSERKRNTGTSLIVVIICVLLIAAAVAWFALSRYNSNPVDDVVSQVESNLNPIVSSIESQIESTTSEIRSDIDSTVSRIESEYNNGMASYNDNESSVSSKIGTTSETAPTGETISSVPYSTTAFCKPVEGEILKDFSENELQYSKTFGDMRIHSGIDIACEKGTAVSSCADGTVLSIEESNQLGTTVTIDHGNGITAKYSALETIKVKAGETVTAGDIIGNVTIIPAECNDQDHLHLELYKNGIAVSPLKALGLD